MNDPVVYVASLALSMTRMTIAIGTLPFASRHWAGRYVILPMALAVAVLVPAPLFELPTGPMMTLLIIKEAAVGLGLGLLIARVFHVVAATGALLDQQAGYTFGATVNPALNITTGPIEALYLVLLTLMLFDGSGAFDLAKALVMTFEGWPVLAMMPVQGWSLDDLSEHLLGPQSQLLYQLALRLAAPAMALLLVADISLMLASRYAEQLNPFSISLALKALMMTLILGWMMQGQLDQWQRLLQTVIPVP